MAAQQPRWFSWFQSFVANGARRLTRAQLLTMLCLARFAHSQTLEAFPSARTIADMLGLNRTTVHRALETLRSEGYIASRTETRPGKYRAYRVEVYSLTAPQLQGRTPSTVASERTENSSSENYRTPQEQRAVRKTVTAHQQTPTPTRKSMDPEQLRRLVADKWASTNHGSSVREWADIISRQLQAAGYDVFANDVVAALPPEASHG